ncbi:hypothetical protein JTE90_029415 [Oedothorax gibbosus]|uniref:Uncharacterized protein n=1 Tax=Oedothorax gibbosus TaxID=931172 RepID=A0AAV6TRG9_9ARAC|nr:hypothetical protein JTE90_029415 [Oedothorax gibbosus]
MQELSSSQSLNACSCSNSAAVCRDSFSTADSWRFSCFLFVSGLVLWITSFERYLGQFGKVDGTAPSLILSCCSFAVTSSHFSS